MQPKYDWEAIKLEYINGYIDKVNNNLHRWPLLKELGEKYNIPLSALNTYCTKDSWVSERKRFWKLVSDNIIEERKRALVEKALAFDDRVFKIAEMGTINVDGHFILAQKDSNDELIVLDESKLEKLSRALLNFQKAGNLIVGSPTEHKLHEGIEFVPTSTKDED